LDGAQRRIQGRLASNCFEKRNDVGGHLNGPEYIGSRGEPELK